MITLIYLFGMLHPDGVSYFLRVWIILTVIATVKLVDKLANYWG